ncbi:MAG: amino acid permease, partial [Verrucomicrobia bacterium]|nr:amino acid permease [Verrucomicrobiota bacterium]
NLHRPFKTPCMPWIPLLGGGCCVVQMALFPLVTWIQLLSWLALGCVVYFTYSIKRSKVQLKHEHKS